MEYPPLTPSPQAWLDCVLSNFNEFICDHASAEKKASGMAMSVASHYPDQPILLAAMADLAVEELSHYREVIKLMINRNIEPASDQKDPYVGQLNKLVRRGAENYLLDRLLIGAVVERRGAERFSLIAENTLDIEIQKFYRAIAKSEDRHWILFLDLAKQHCDAHTVVPRFNELTQLEADIMLASPIRAALH